MPGTDSDADGHGPGGGRCEAPWPQVEGGEGGRECPTGPGFVAQRLWAGRATTVGHADKEEGKPRLGRKVGKGPQLTRTKPAPARRGQHPWRLSGLA